MSDAPDTELLEQFARDQSEDAFAELVRRHIGLVHSVALRHTVNPEQAQDITQAVFIILARKAGSLRSGVVLPGWLYHTARFTAANFQRVEMRRIHREQEAFMQSTLEEPASDALWRELAPLLDDAMGRLRAGDRDAIVLRFFQNQSLAKVGASMGIAERAAQKRVNRALEKLRKIFTQHGVTSTTTTIAETISAHSIQIPPETLAKLMITAAITKGATASVSSIALAKATLVAMKTKTLAITSALATFIILGAGTLFLAESKTNQPPAITSQQYQVTGDIQTTYYDKQGNVATRISATFTARLSNQTWEIIMPASPKGDYAQISFDGTNMYQLLDMEAGVAAMRARGSSVADNLANGFVARVEVPHDAFTEACGLVWLAFASGNYFEKHRQNELLEQPYYQREMRPPSRIFDSVKTPATWTMENKLPAHVVYYAEDGTTNAEYDVSAFKPFSGHQLPSEATLDVYYDIAPYVKTSPEMIAANHHVFCEYRIATKTLAALQEPLMFPPRVPVLTDITDYRLRNQANPFRAVFYKTDQAFKTEAEVQKLPKNQKLELYTATRKVVRPVADSSSHIIRNALIAVFLAFSGTALFLFLRKPGQGLPSRR